MSKYKRGDVVTGSVTGIEKYGIFVSLDEYYSGLIHISEISDSFVRNISDYVKIGETIKSKVLEDNEKSFHVKLSIKNFNYQLVKRKEIKIIETVTGFTTLNLFLNDWIESKYNELDIIKTKKK